MLKKFTNKKGFTLMEMLIVVAIIAVLVAIAIPTFSGALTKSKEAADVANIRAAYAEYQVKAISGETVDDRTWTTLIGNFKLNYNGDTHGYSLGADKKTITYKSTKLDGGKDDGGKTYVWTLGSTAD